MKEGGENGVREGEKMPTGGGTGARITVSESRAGAIIADDENCRARQTGRRRKEKEKAKYWEREKTL